MLAAARAEFRDGRSMLTMSSEPGSCPDRQSSNASRSLYSSDGSDRGRPFSHSILKPGGIGNFPIGIGDHPGTQYVASCRMQTICSCLLIIVEGQRALRSVSGKQESSESLDASSLSDFYRRRIQYVLLLRTGCTEIGQDDAYTAALAWGNDAVLCYA